MTASDLALASLVALRPDRIGTTERLAEISERLTTPRLGRSMARETDLDLLAIRALLAEVRRLQALAAALGVETGASDE